MIPKELNCAGIYAIRHVTDGKVYVGQSQNIARRIRQHMSSKSKCTYIKNAIQAHGWAEFEVSVLEEIQDFEMFDQREEYWIDALNTADPKSGYNICSFAGSCRGVIHNPEARAKMSASKKGKPLSDEHKARISEGGKGINGRPRIAKVAKPQNSHIQTPRRQTKLVRVYESDIERLEAIRRALIKQDGAPHSMAEVVAHVMDQTRCEILHSPEFQRPAIERLEY